MKLDLRAAEIHRLSQEQIAPELFDGFDRTQIVRRCWRKEQGAWLLKDVAFAENWDAADWEKLAAELRQIASEGGAVFAAMAGRRMVGFAAVRSGRFGSRRQYVQLAELYVSAESRSAGIGGALFGRAREAARALGAQKLYISAHSSEETQRFYRRMGCVEAAEYDPRLTALEPCDCQMECALEQR